MIKFAINTKLCDMSPRCPVRRQCPVSAVRQVDDRFYIDQDVCRGCGVCVRICPRGAVEESAS